MMRCNINVDLRDVINMLQDFDDEHKEEVRILKKDISELWTVIRVICWEYKHHHNINKEDIELLLGGELPCWSSEKNMKCYADLGTWDDLMRDCEVSPAITHE